MTIDMSKANDKDATIKVMLQADSGKPIMVDFRVIAEEEYQHLRTALTEALAREAAAFEAAADACLAAYPEDGTYGPSEVHIQEVERATVGVCQEEIRDLTPADAQAALDRMIEDADGRGMRKAAAIVDNDVQKLQPEMTKRAQRLKDAKSPGFQYAIHRADLDARMSCRDKILAAIPKGKDHD